MSKKGVISLEALVKFIPAILIAITALYVLFTLWGAFFAEEMSVPQNDLVRVASNIKSLAPDETIDVFTKGQEYEIAMYPAGNAEPMCSKKACVCVNEYNTVKKKYFTTRCEVFSNEDCTKSPKNPGFICIKSMAPTKIENIDQTKKIDYLRISRSKTGGIITMNLNPVTL